jgi:hypothetical protein
MFKFQNSVQDVRLEANYAGRSSRSGREHSRNLPSIPIRVSAQSEPPPPVLAHHGTTTK